MAGKVKREILEYGLRVLLSRHPEVRRLKRLYKPFAYGNTFSNSSWILMDYFKHRGLAEGARIMEVGCGWGLSGIYCAKRYGAVVMSADIDPEVFPFLHLHAAINNVKIPTVIKGFNGLRNRDLAAVDILIGSDICFWNKLVDPLRLLILRALRAGVQLILIADPGRSPFERLAAHFITKGRGEVLDWSIKRPKKFQGQILRVAGNRKGLED